MNSPVSLSRYADIGALAARWLAIILLAAAYLTIMLESSSRMYWPYMLSSYAIATIFFICSAKRKQAGEKLSGLPGYFFSRDIWLHPSAIRDYALFLINNYIFFTISAHLILTEKNSGNIYNLCSSLIFMLSKHLHVPRSAGAPGVIAILIFSVCSFLLTELFNYVWHRAMHKSPLLWQFHKVHHSAEVMTPLTYIRGHPLEIWFENILHVISLSIASAVFYYLYPDITGATVAAGIDMVVIAAYFIGANLHHSNIWISYGRKIERVIMSPAQHQIHHSTDKKHYDRNFGSMISFWDWVFGTLYLVEGREKIVFGLTGKDHEDCNTLWGLYINPLKSVWKWIK